MPRRKPKPDPRPAEETRRDAILALWDLNRRWEEARTAQDPQLAFDFSGAAPPEALSQPDRKEEQEDSHPARKLALA